MPDSHNARHAECSLLPLSCLPEALAPLGCLSFARLLRLSNMSVCACHWSNCRIIQYDTPVPLH